MGYKFQSLVTVNHNIELQYNHYLVNLNHLLVHSFNRGRYMLCYKFMDGDKRDKIYKTNCDKVLYIRRP